MSRPLPCCAWCGRTLTLRKQPQGRRSTLEFTKVPGSPLIGWCGWCLLPPLDPLYLPAMNGEIDTARLLAEIERRHPGKVVVARG